VCHLLKELAGLTETADVDQHAAKLNAELPAQRIVDSELLERNDTSPDNTDCVLQATE
jgi:hypothetical protein